MSKHFHRVKGGTDPRTGEELNCTGCHRPHASDEVKLLSHEPKRELCLQCHDPTMAPKPKKKS
jgi:predicted CXXCH cytochrome family protein